MIVVALFAAVYTTHASLSASDSKSASVFDKKMDVKSEVDSAIKNVSFYTVTNATNPSIAVDSASGTIYAVYSKGIANTTGAAGFSAPADIFLIRSDDHGKTFSQPVRVNNVAGDADQAVWDHPHVVAGSDSKVYVMWYNNTSSSDPRVPFGITKIHFARSTDGGRTFESTIAISPNDPGQEQSFGDITVSKDNKVHISYLAQDYFVKDPYENKESNMRVSTSEDGGKTFRSGVIADHSSCPCCETKIAAGPDGETYVAWRHAYKSDPVPLQSQDNNTNPYAFRWEGASQNLIIRDIVLSRTNDNGNASKFSSPVQVHPDNWLMNGCPDAGAGMAFDSKGRMHVAWFTGSDNAAQGPGYYYAYSDDRGATFSKPVALQLLSEKWIVPTTVTLATDGNDRVWVSFVNDEGSYDRNNNFVSNGNLHLSILDRDGNLIWKGPLATGEIKKHYPGISSGSGMMSFSWIDGNDVKIGTVPLAR